MTADLGKYTDLHVFKEAFPDRYYQMGMAEQLLMGAAAGSLGTPVAFAAGAAVVLLASAGVAAARPFRHEAPASLGGR